MHLLWTNRCEWMASSDQQLCLLPDEFPPKPPSCRSQQKSKLLFMLSVVDAFSV